MAGQKRLTPEQKKQVKELFRALPLSLSLKECHARIAVSTGLDFNVRSLQRWVKSEGWERDLAEEVRAETARKMMKAQIIAGAEQAGIDPTELDGDEAAQVEAAANAAASVLIAHQEDLGDLRYLFSKLSEQAKEQIIEQKIAVLCPKSGEMVLATPSLSYGIDALNKLTKILKEIIPLERQAYGVDSAENGDTSDDILLELAQEAQANAQETE